MVYDTNILIAYLNGEESVVRFILQEREQGRVQIVSSITVAELLSLERLTSDEVRIIRDLLRSFLVVPFDQPLAERAGEIRRVYRLTVPDAAIVATALAYAVPLATRDKGVQKVKQLIILSL